MSVQASTSSRRLGAARTASLVRRRALAASLVVVVLLVGLGLAFAGNSGELARGATVAGVDVGGLTPVEARRLLAKRAAAVERTPVSFTAGGQNLRLSASQLGIRLDWQSAIARVDAAGSGFTPLRGYRRLRARVFGLDVTPRAAFYESVVTYTVAQLARRVDRSPREPVVRRTGLRISVVDGLAGRTLDQAAARVRVIATLAGLERGAPVALPLVAAHPKHSVDELADAVAKARLALSAPLTLTARRTRWRVARWELAQILRLPAAGRTELAIGGSSADRWLASLQRRVDRPARDATFAVRPGGIDVVPAKEGRELDVAATVAAVLRAASTTDRRTVDLPVVATQAERSTAEAKAMGINGVVGSYTTTYGGTPGRLANVQLVARLIDGALVAPDGTFSFNGTTGERTAAQGFQEAPVIINGELQTGIGGGVCQVSTTVFNAAFEAGLPILARTNHALYISHYPLGRDATVNYPDLDLRFANDTGHWLLVRAFANAGSLTVNLYGTPTRRRVESETEPLTVTGKVPIERTPDPELTKGKRVIEVVGTPPRETRVVRRVYGADGTLLSESSWASYYRAEPTKVRVGTKPKPKPKAHPTADTPASEFNAGSPPGRISGPAAPALP